MNEKEKKAIIYFDDILTNKCDIEFWKRIKNLINKQQKEIEDLKEITQNYNAIGGETFGDDRIIVCSMKYFDDGYFKKNYITKDKIRKLIKKYRILNNGQIEGLYDKEILALQELLEE